MVISVLMYKKAHYSTGVVGFWGLATVMGEREAEEEAVEASSVMVGKVWGRRMVSGEEGEVSGDGGGE